MKKFVEQSQFKSHLADSRRLIQLRVTVPDEHLAEMDDVEEKSRIAFLSSSMMGARFLTCAFYLLGMEFQISTHKTLVRACKI